MGLENVHYIILLKDTLNLNDTALNQEQENNICSMLAQEQNNNIHNMLVQEQENNIQIINLKIISIKG
ncbi:13191_t:CDS:2 [Cetraspora pellucida]|uniref:13191_t:CDS:1 n=1 Tax=Cetraspora pellucida TaxID=1433469 RepID=A0A9N9BLZ4_9GLOM|nr:13191_t:CDS:2 [Cetraspora pellucida]